MNANLQRVRQSVIKRRMSGAREGQVSKDTDLTRRTVRKHLQRLADLGSIRYVEVRLTGRRERLWFPAG